MCYNGYMKEKILRIRMPFDLFKRLSHICIEKQLSLTKQTCALVKEFVSIQEENEKRIKKEI